MINPLDSLGDPVAALPRRLPLRTWLVVVGTFLCAYGMMFSLVHVAADTRACLTHLPDPLFPLIPRDPRWYYVSHEVYYVFNAAGTIALLITAVRGDHRGLARFGLGLALMALMRSISITLLPFCKITVAPGSIALTQIPYADLGFARIPWRMWATNDLIFSGHVCEFILLSFAIRDFPRWAKRLLIVFQLLQGYALIATRGHYTIDVVIAIPVAILANDLALVIIRRLSTVRQGTRSAGDGGPLPQHHVQQLGG